MGYKTAIIGETETVMGFLLAGVTHYHIHKEKSETLEKMEKLLSDPQVGIIFLTARVKEELGEDLVHLLRKITQPTPMVVIIPDSTGYYPPQLDEIERIVKRTTGVEVITGK